MRRFAPVMLASAAAVAAAPPAHAALFEAGVAFLGQYTDNANDVGAGAVRVSDYAVSASPWVMLRSEEGGRLRYETRYETTYRRRFRVDDEPDDLDHTFRVRTSYEIDPKTTVRFEQRSDALQDLVRNTRSAAGQPISDQVPDIFGRERRIRMGFTLSLERRLALNTLATFSASHSFVDSSDERRFDSSSNNLLFSLNRQVSSKLRLGLGASATFQEAEDTDFRRGSATDFYRAFASFRYELTESLALSGNFGPLLVQPEDRSNFAAGQVFPRRLVPLLLDDDGALTPADPLSCPIGDNGLRFFDPLLCDPVSGLTAGQVRQLVDNTSLVRSVLGAAEAAKEATSRQTTTIGLELALTKTWRHARASVRFNRRAGETSDLGTSTVTDTLWLDFNWTPDRDWRVSLSGIVSRQASTNELLVPRPSIAPIRLTRPDPINGDKPVDTGIDVAGATGIEVLASSSSAADLTSLRFRARLERVMTRQLASFVEFTWRDQTFENDRISTGRDFQGIQVWIGFTYRIQPRLLRLPF